MITIGEIVNTYIQNHPFIQQAMSDDLINFSSLARVLRPKVEKELMKRVEASAVGMALRRSAAEMKKKHTAVPIIQPEEIVVRSGIVEYTFAKSNTIASTVATFLHSIAKENTYFSAVTQGVFEVAVIVSAQYEAKVKKVFEKEKITSIHTKMSAITLRLPMNNVVVPGVYNRFLQKLAWEHINIIDIVSTLTEFTVLLSEKEVDRAFTLLKE